MATKQVAKKQKGARRAVPASAPKKTVAKAPPAAPSPAPTKRTKIETVAEMLQRNEGATLEQIMVATSWQQHSVRGALAGAIPKKFGRSVTSKVADGVRTYRLGA